MKYKKVKKHKRKSNLKTKWKLRKAFLTMRCNKIDKKNQIADLA